MFWTGRYIERAQALARVMQAVERLSLDLPGRHALGLRPLLALVKRRLARRGGCEPGRDLRALALNGEDTSSVLGALVPPARICAKRASLRLPNCGPH